ncbi:Oidioi.mRNA.OKI2018_I69.XSR.g16162.t1.cds [Oikopleura dioica]|uniref:Oidioi.mRNA.OKI2018_I69.XSR.g16162.t1.cds n=1 Tax=Oikopleura dioica TaxID=34765 RepID=A0ABN7SK44_OIKDI|nr:Oidioi.mRNA.OKI2018_I69.XSR.g16162.t1.cds [Oikopleura dioica]
MAETEEDLRQSLRALLLTEKNGADEALVERKRFGYNRISDKEFLSNFSDIMMECYGRFYGIPLEVQRPLVSLINSTENTYNRRNYYNSSSYDRSDRHYREAAETQEETLYPEASYSSMKNDKNEIQEAQNLLKSRSESSAYEVEDRSYEKCDYENAHGVSRLPDLRQQKWNPENRFYLHPNHPNRKNEQQLISNDFKYAVKSVHSAPKTEIEAKASISSFNVLDTVNQERYIRPPSKPIAIKRRIIWSHKTGSG